jgi:peptidoglycan/xylan/chitin deacetylase (PgdA/CDA1 family)
VHESGHELGNHAFSHRSLRSLWATQIRDELSTTNAAISDVIGRQPALFRPPFGRYAPSALTIIGELGMNVVLWSVDAFDWNREPAAIAAAVVHEPGPGDIVLLHDRTSRTVHALPAIIRGLRERGFELVTVSELTGLPAYR